MIQPKFINLTDEEINELLRIPDPASSTRWSGGYHYVGSDWSNDWEDFGTYQPKRKHEYVPILLSFQTVYNCKHCDAKKEDAKGDYCED